MFNKITETGICTPVRLIDECGFFTSPNYTFVPSPIIIIPTVSVTTNKSLARTFVQAVHTAITKPQITFNCTKTIAVTTTQTCLRTLNRTLTTNVTATISVARTFTRTVTTNVLLNVSTNKELTRSLTVPITFTIQFLRNAGFIMRTKAVGIVGQASSVLKLYYQNKEQVK